MKVKFVAEKLTVTVRASGAHIDVLTVQDAMRQILDIFELLEAGTAVQWSLVHASTNSPFHLQAEAVSFEPAVDVSVIARAQKVAVANGLREIAAGRYPENWANDSRRLNAAKRLFNRNTNGIGATVIDFESGEPITVTPVVAAAAIRVLGKQPEDSLYVMPSGKQEIGSIEGTLYEVATHWNHPAIRVVDARTKAHVWCRLSTELQQKFADKATFADIWEHKRVVIRGRLRYDDEGTLAYVLANDVEKIDQRSVTVDAIKDKEFSGGLSVVEYLDKFRDGALG